MPATRRLLGWNDAALGVARSRGWTDDALDRLEVGWDDAQHRAILPVRDQAGDLLGELRYDPTGKLNPKMLAHHGVPRELFPPPEMIGDEEVHEHTLWLVEGEPDAIRAWSLGLPAVGVPGAAAWRTEWAARFTGRHWKIALCFDCDQAGRRAATRAADDLTRAGVDVRIIDLDPDRDDGHDLTDWTHQAQSPQEMKQAASMLHGWAADTRSHVPAAPQGESNGSGNAAPGAYRATGGAATGMVWQCAREFVYEEDDLTAPLVGEPDDMLLPMGGILLMYGKGGAGKTTLTVDAICHLASGTTWLGQPVPVPLNISLIENEGRVSALRRRLRTRADSWDGEPWLDRVDVYVKPWHGFSFQDEHCRQGLADRITQLEIDLVVVGPLVAIGAMGGGTPEEVHTFEQLLDDTRARTPLEPAFWIIHHENKAGDVSGAWDRMPDAMLHVSGQGNGHTRLHFRKARDSSLHDTAVNLSWNGSFSFTIDEDKRLDETEIMTRIRELYEGDDQWRTAEEVRAEVMGNRKTVRSSLDQLVEGEVLACLKGPPGRHPSSLCWRLAQSVSVQPTLGDPGHGVTQGHPGSPTHTGGDGEFVSQGVPPPVRGEPLGETTDPRHKTAHKTQVDPANDPDPTLPDDGIPF